jgi:trehalose 6-phosphate synthase
VLVLSRFAGAAHECKEALLVNPYDTEAVAAAINRALSMPLEERRERHTAMYATLLHNDIDRWAERFIATLTRPPRAANWPFSVNLAANG